MNADSCARGMSLVIELELVLESTWEHWFLMK